MCCLISRHHRAYLIVSIEDFHCLLVAVCVRAGGICEEEAQRVEGKESTGAKGCNRGTEASGYASE